jgi:hypothetical protein
MNIGIRLGAGLFTAAALGREVGDPNVGYCALSKDGVDKGSDIAVMAGLGEVAIFVK